jgi:ribonuclease HII
MFESRFISELPLEIIAVDEVGRSPLCGPVVIGGTRLIVEDQKDFMSLLRSLRSVGVKDSKALTPVKRKKLLAKLNLSQIHFRQNISINYKNFELSFMTIDIGPEVIDEKNIFQAVLAGMKDVVTALARKGMKRTLILIDGPFFLHFAPEDARWIEIPVIQGDVKSTLIGLSAVLAKETRDTYMKAVHELYPQYGLNENMGYPTKEHRQALTIHGPTPLHRMSFSDLKKFQSKKVE